MNISIEQFAKEAGVSRTIIHKRILRREIKPIAIVEDGKLVFRIDDKKYLPSKHGARESGRPKKKLQAK